MSCYNLDSTSCNSFRSAAEIDDTLELDQLLSKADKAKDVEFSSERSLERYFTRDKVRKMIEFITVEPPQDADKDRGHSIPFHSDMIFQFNKCVINYKFFNNDSSDDEDEVEWPSAAKKSSPHKMIDVFMTPQSEDDSSEGDSPDVVQTSPPKNSGIKVEELGSPPVSSFAADAEEESKVETKDEVVKGDTPRPIEEEKIEEVQVPSDTVKDADVVPVVEAEAEPVVEADTEVAISKVVDIVAAPVKSTSAPVVEVAAEPVLEAVAELIVEATAEPIADAVPDAIPEPVADAVVVPVIDAIP